MDAQNLALVRKELITLAGIMAEQRNWNMLGVILPTAEFREPVIYILKMYVLLCLYSHFCIMITFLIMSININLV